MTATITPAEASPPGGGSADEGLFAKLERQFGKLTSVMNMIGTIWIIIMAILVVVDVIGLNVFRQSVPAVKEFIQLSIPGIVFLQLANTLREERHVSSDVFINKLRNVRPRVASFTYGIFNLIGMALMLFLSYRIFPKAGQAYWEGFTRGHEGILTLPEWPSMALVVFGAAIMGLQYLFLSVRDFRAAFTGAQAPRHDGGTSV
jgi:TRAP-type C4-dicarboxylate transport system permease small subunit